MSDRTAAEIEHELAMLAYVRDRLRASEDKDFTATAVDLVLDEPNGLELFEPQIDIGCHEKLVPCRRCKTLVNRWSSGTTRSTMQMGAATGSITIQVASSVHSAYR